MADMCDTCGDGVVELLRKLLAEQRDAFIRLGQINESIAAGGGGGGGGNVNLTQIGSVAQSGADVVDIANTALRVNVVAGGGAGGTSSTFGIANPGTGTAAGFSDGTNMQMGRVFDGDTGGGTQYVLGSILRASGAGGTVETGVAANPLRTDPTGTTTQPISAAALPLPAGAATSALQTQPGVDIGDVTVNNGAGGAAVNIQDGGNTITVDGTITATPSGVQDIQGNVAHDAVDSGNPVKTGAVAIAHGTNPTAVAAADRTNLYANRAGIPFVLGGHPNIITLEAAYTAAQTDIAIVTVGAGAKIVVTAIAALCDNANTVDVGFRIGFGAATTPTTTGVVLTHPGVSPGSGYNRGDGSGILGVGADGEDLRITSEVPTTGSIRILVSYFTIES